MRRFVVGAATCVLAVWLLLFLSEAIDQPGSLAAAVLYVLSLLCPSLCFWFLIWITRSLAPTREWLVGIHGWMIAAAVLICASAVVPAAAQNAGPGLASVSPATYASGLVLGLASLVRWPRVKHYILENRLLGFLAVGAAASFTLGSWAATSLFGNEITLGVAGSLALVLFYLLTVLLIILALLNERRVQAGAAIVALGVHALNLVGPTDVFFPLWLTGTFFWPLVILSSLALEVALLRIFLRPGVVLGGGEPPGAIQPSPL